MMIPDERTKGMFTAKHRPVAPKIEARNFARFAFFAVNIRFVRLPDDNSQAGQI
jgi:hypothetical protein